MLDFDLEAVGAAPEMLLGLPMEFRLAAPQVIHDFSIFWAVWLGRAPYVC